ncbi:MAG: hypothetical protein LBF38_11715, partial [Deltaproteobacteria bacterium]|nr:hypothetical protein [Deltaproteobacteria bacterium]
LPSLGVTQHRALRSPDFPLDRSTDPAVVLAIPAATDPDPPQKSRQKPAKKPKPKKTRLKSI